MGLEPTISCLGSKRSTTELHPLGLTDWIISDMEKACQADEILRLSLDLFTASV